LAEHLLVQGKEHVGPFGGGRDGRIGDPDGISILPAADAGVEAHLGVHVKPPAEEGPPQKLPQGLDPWPAAPAILIASSIVPS